MSKKNWLKEDLDRLKNTLKFPAGLFLVAFAPWAVRYAPRAWFGLSVPAYMVGAILLAQGAWLGSKALDALLGPRVARTILCFAALVFTAICGCLMKAPNGEFAWSIALFWLPPAIAFAHSIRDFAPSIDFKPWSGAAVLKLEKKKARAGETVTAELVMRRPCRDLKAKLELCDGTQPGGDFVFTSHPAEITALSMKNGRWIATVTARLPDDAPASLEPDEDDEETGEGRSWELQVEGVEENGKPVEAWASVEVR